MLHDMAFSDLDPFTDSPHHILRPSSSLVEKVKVLILYMKIKSFKTLIPPPIYILLSLFTRYHYLNRKKPVEPGLVHHCLIPAMIYLWGLVILAILPASFLAPLAQSMARCSAQH
ncbi:hypothetical protein CEXT_302771 [Caerostris extrusa]|uniref:Uncharacterized protein n=1 Tax=Caerostris extrusa TaxID=172846 RepID=A0AAV4NJR6_CAEEX|nr:hypothetical protein CEXT_302771 [Caerostris extrusa]